MKSVTSFTVIIGAAVFCQSSIAAITYDGFAYTVGSNLEDSTDWDGLNSGTAPVIAAGNLAVTGLTAPSGDKVSFAGGNIREAIGSLATYNSDTVFFSIALQLTTVPTSTTYSLALATGNTNYGATVWLQASDTEFNIGLGNRSSGVTPTYTTGSFALNQTIFLVGSYEFVEGTANDVSRLWVNPSSSTFAADSAPIPTLTSTGGTDLNAVSQFLIRGASGSPAGEVDELRVGTTWASVTPIPESASLLLGALGLLGLLLRRR